MRRQLAAIEDKLSDAALWSDPKLSQPIMRDRKRLEALLADADELERRQSDIDAYFDLAREGEPVEEELGREISSLTTFSEKLEARTLLSGETDQLNAIVTVHPGAGGTESQDWAEMLMRMYLRWAEREGFKTEMNDYQDGEEAGIKSATFTVTGDYAFGLLSGETGVHRWSVSRPLTRPSAAIPHSPPSSSRPRSTTRSSSTSSPTICGRILIDRAARAASTSTRQTPPYASPICPPTSSSSARTSAPSTRTKRRQ